MRSAIKVYLALICSFLLVACGGGGSITDDGSGVTPTPEVISISLETSTNDISIDNPATLTATVSSSKTGALANKVVTFTLSDNTFGTFNPVSGTANTNSDGVATITLATSTQKGAVTVTAILDSGETASTGVSMAGDGAEPGENQILTSLRDAAGNAITNIAFATPGYLHVTYTDPAGQPIKNRLVSFSIDDTNLATFVPNSGTALTDEDGTAIIKIIAANKEGAGRISVTIDEQGPATFDFYSKGDAGVSGSASISARLLNDAGAEITTISSATPGTIETTLLDASGNPLVNKVINFSLTSSEHGIFDPVSGTALTNSSGVATIKLRTSDIETATTANISTDDGVNTSISFYMQGDGTAQNINSLTLQLVDGSGSPLSIVSNSSPAIVLATYLNADGQPISGQLATFSTGLGSISVPTTVTNASGIASVMLTAGQVAGAAIISVSINGQTASLAFETLGDEPNPIDAYALSVVVRDSFNNENRNITQSKPGIVFATLLKNGIAVPSELIQFSLIGQGQINPTSGHALTDASGVAKVNLLTGLVDGAGTIEAKFVLGGETLTNSFNYSVAGDAPGGDGENLTLTIELLDSISGSSTANISQASPGRARVYLVDRDNNPVSGAVISYSSSLGEFLPAVGTALTNNAGQAEILITAGTVEGAATITASYDVATANLSFTTAGDDIDAVAADPSISFEIYDCNGVAGFDKALKNFELCPVTDNITNQRPGILGAVVKLEGSNQPLKQVLVSAGTTLGAISPNSATAITNADGKAVLDLYSNGDVGAGEVTLRVKQVSSTKAFEIGRVDISLDISTYIGSGTLPAGGSTVIEVTVNDSTGAIETSQPFTLEFTSQCMASGSSVIDTPVVTNAGKGFATYRSINCEGTDTVTVSAITGASTVSSTTDIIIDPVQVGAIEFISALPTELALKVSGGLSGAGSRSETSTVAFRLLNEVGQAAGSERVCFELSTDVGGITLTPAPLASDFINCPNFPKVGDTEYPADINAPNKYAVAYSDANGQVEVTVRSGTVPTPVKVFAVWQDSASAINPIVANVSDSLTITTGLADFNSFSLSSVELNLEGWEHDGETTTLTIRSADHFNNPVPAGTLINFMAEGGSVGASCQTIDKTGACSVDWTSQNPRPFDQTAVTCPVAFNGSNLPPCIGTTLSGFLDKSNSVIPEPRPGRATITAYAIGEESFVDLNGNGLYDYPEDGFDNSHDKSEAFTDHNEDGVYRGGASGAVNEEFIDYNNDGSFNLGDGLYTGLLCASSSSAFCTQTGIGNTQAQLNVFRNLTLVMSGSTPYGHLVDVDVAADSIIPATEIDLTLATGVSSKTVYLFVSDVNNNTLANGTTISASTDNGELSSSTQQYTIGNNTSNMPLVFAFTVGRETSPNQRASGLLSITVATKYGDPVTFTVNVRDDG